MDTALNSVSFRLRQALSEVMQNGSMPSTAVVSSGKVPVNADVVVSHNEVNDSHGVGVLIQKIFGNGPELISLRSQDHFGGHQRFGKANLRLAHGESSRREIFVTVLNAFADTHVSRVVCIPYYADDVKNAIALKHAFGARLCTYIMDDQNVVSNEIPDELMAELLENSALRLAIWEDMRQAYEKKFSVRFWLMPPLISEELVQGRAAKLPAQHAAKRAVIVGNIWGQRWMELLRKTVRNSGLEIDWYANHGLQWHTITPEELAGDGIQVRQGLPELELAARLPDYSFAVLPSGTLDEADDRRAIAQLSLPSRVPFLLAGGLPILVIGARETAVARFVDGFGLGVCSAYEAEAFRRAVAGILETQARERMRQKAAEIVPMFSARGAGEWLWRSLEIGSPADMRFESALHRMVSSAAEQSQAAKNMEAHASRD